MDEREGGSPIFGRLLIAVIIAVISLISYYGNSVYNPVTHEKQHVNITADQEIRLGLQAAPQMAAQYGGIEPNQHDQQVVTEVGNRVISRSDAHESPYKFQFHVLADPKTINAFALPGGQIFITEGLLRKLTTPGELAGVLSHEIGHVVDRHGAQHLAKERLTQGLGGAAVIASSDPNNPNSARNAAIAMAVTQLVNLRFGRQDELKADRWGVRYMTQAGFDPRSMIEVMRILQSQSQGGAPPEFFSTHPNPDHRIERIEQAIQQEFPEGVPAGLEK
jgi:beta-barrel assembly-enhancing protease